MGNISLAIMKFVSIAIVAAALVVCAAALHPDHLAEDVYQSMWEDFKSTHEKEYTSAEEPFRFLIFKDNVDQINRHNAEFSAGKQSFTMGVTQFADLTKHEFQAYYLNFKPSQAPKSGRVHTFSGSVVDLPTSVNWVTKGAVTDVKNQGQCGSCWAFSTCAGIEGLMAVSGKGLTSLSPQELVDCDTRDNGCNGGLMDNGFTWIIQNGGICSWTAYPYTAQDGSCQNVASISGYKNVDQSTNALMSAVAQQPVSIAVDASNWSFYTGDILPASSCGQQLDHGVLAAGYGSDSGKDYWLVKNSWGTSWGESDYIRLARGQGEDTCGLLNSASYPTN